MKMKVYSNARVVIDLSEPYLIPIIAEQASTLHLKEKEERWLEIQQREAKDLLSQIKRHVDGIGRHGHSEPYLDFDTEEICSHCRLDWVEVPRTGEPLCCPKAKEEWKGKP